jgi:CBS domain-containing protein
MRTDIVSVRPDATLGEAVKLLLEHRISGLPVTDENGLLLGVISEFALLAITYEPLADRQPVQDHMTKHVISVTPDTGLKELADTFILRRIRRLPVTKHGRLVGMVSRRELLRAAVAAGEPICHRRAAATS